MRRAMAVLFGLAALTGCNIITSPRKVDSRPWGDWISCDPAGKPFLGPGIGIEASMTGEDLDPDYFRVIRRFSDLDYKLMMQDSVFLGAECLWVAPLQSAAGATFTLSDIASNCTVEENPIRVSWIAWGPPSYTAHVHFKVTCTAQ